MDKKNFVSSELHSHAPAVEWTTPAYHRGKENYVDFYAFDPGTGRMRRKKVMLDRVKGVRERNARARQLVEQLTQKLLRG